MNEYTNEINSLMLMVLIMVGFLGFLTGRVILIDKRLDAIDKKAAPPDEQMGEERK